VREALAARSGRDFVMTGGSPGAGRKLALSAARTAFMFAVRRPSLFLGSAVLVAGFAVVAFNALAWQTARHPAPLFARKTGAPERRVLPPAPLPPARPAEVAQPAPPAAPPIPPVVVRTSSKDPIGDLIRAADPAAAKESAKIAAAQRALAKLGYYALKPDGVIGPGTRQAIEKFERDRKLVPTGELGARTARELAREAGFAIE
jgi:Putative peptidoglycan binding domain